jgi:hypothetical protein
MVPEVATLAGSGGGEGKNATFAYSVGHSGGNNSTGFPARFYNGLLIEPNAIVGQTGRGIYATGDITGTASQYPYGPVQTDGTWLHGIDHTKAVYQDNSAETLAVGQAQRWITGPTTAPTGAATITGTGSGANISLALVPAGLGAVSVGTATSSGTQVNVNGAVTTKPGLSLYSGGSQRWAISLDPFPESGGNAGSNLALYNYADNGANIGNPMSILRGSGAIFIANCFGVWGTAPPATKPVISGAKGGNTALASVIALLVAYGLGSDSST